MATTSDGGGCHQEQEPGGTLTAPRRTAWTRPENELVHEVPSGGSGSGRRWSVLLGVALGLPEPPKRVSLSHASVATTGTIGARFCPCGDALRVPRASPEVRGHRLRLPVSCLCFSVLTRTRFKPREGRHAAVAATLLRLRVTFHHLPASHPPQPVCHKESVFQRPPGRLAPTWPLTDVSLLCGRRCVCWSLGGPVYGRSGGLIASELIFPKQL